MTPLPEASPNTALASIRSSDEAKKQTIHSIRQCFALCDTYGKTAKDMDLMIDGFIAMLAEYPADKVIRAFRTHVERSQKLPTLADIIGLIKRNGRPPLNESDVVRVSKIDPEHRTRDQWALLREWDNQQAEGWGADDAQRTERHDVENRRLRQRVRELEVEVKRLGGLLRKPSGFSEKPTHPLRLTYPPVSDNPPTHCEKMRATIDQMRKDGCTQTDIEDFIAFENVMQSASNMPQEEAFKALGDMGLISQTQRQQ